MKKAGNVFTGIIVMIFAVVFMGIGIVAFFALDKQLVKDKEFNKNAKTVEAVITKIDKNTSTTKKGSSNSKSSTYDIYLAYEVDGVKYNDESFRTSDSKYEVGEIISVYYNSEDPSDVSDSLKLISANKIMYKIVPIVFVAIGIIFLISGIRTARSGIKE